MAEDGEAALAAVQAKTFDAILLDILMPGIDGFGVLEALKSDPSLRDIPVIVISALDDDAQSVVRAIENGAEDFLPKNFDPVLLRARLNASLAKKRFRDQELEYFRRVDRLTAAAEVMESGAFSPNALQLDDLAARNDPLGRLAAVFRGMANEIFDREKRLQRTIQLLQGSLIVIAIGIVWGAQPSLARLVSQVQVNPIGLAIWVNLAAALICLSIAAYRRVLPRLNLSQCLFFLGWATLNGVLTRIMLLLVAEHVEATVLALLATLQSFLVLAIAAATRTEKVSARRLCGVLLGLAGVAMILLSRLDPTEVQANVWLLAALVLPALYGIEWAFLGNKRPEQIDVTATVGIMMLFSAVMLVPIAYATGNLVWLSIGFGQLELLIVLMAAATTISLVLCLRLVATAGAVFASQSAYTMTIAGVVWGMLLLNEQLSIIAWAAVAMILIGLYLVEPDVNNDTVILKRSFATNNAASV